MRDGKRFQTYFNKWIVCFMHCLCDLYRSRDSAVGIATGYGLDDRGVGVESR
jgi:hypothetical protein